MKQEYESTGIAAELGLVIGNENNPQENYVAKSTSCALLSSTKRPVWGMVMWNNPFLKFDQIGFQQVLFVGVIV